ncbi:MAG: phospholipase D family protein [Acidimicrobiales bacterium]
MLDPDNRHLLVDALKPPTGMVLDRAVGTSFTLDLQALLLAPVSFAVFGAAALDSNQGSDPLALMEAVRRHADRITVFCQAGCIAVPRRLQPVLAWLEDSVVPVAPPPGHLFHPKVWLLRFVDDDGRQLHRLLVSSRNLTFDSSWDTIVRLDEHRDGGEPHDNEPLARFVRSLPGRAVQRVSPERVEEISDLAASVGGVRWELPEGASELHFWPLGMGGARPDLTGDRLLVVSPFLSVDKVLDLAKHGEKHVLVSRADAIDEVGRAALAGYEETWVLDADTVPADHEGPAGEIDAPAAGPDAEATDGQQADGDAPDDTAVQALGEIERPGTILNGLHAKVYLVERGRRAHLFTGSANATGAAFGGNVELLVEVVGDTKNWGVDAMLDAKGHKATLRDMLRRHRPTQPEPSEPSELDQLGYRLDSLVRRIAAERFTVTLAADGDEYALRITSDGPMPEIVDGVTVTMRLASVGEGTRLHATLAGGMPLDHTPGSVTLAGISSFLVVTATATHDGTELTSSALVNAQLVGAPADRKERILTSAIKNTDDLIRYLLFLLHDLSDDTQLDALMARYGIGGSSWNQAGEIPLFETMLRALARGGRTLDHVAERLADICATDEGRDLLPPGFDAVWGPIDEVRAEMSR